MSAEKPPSMNDILTALSIVRPQGDASGITKHLPTIIVAATIGIGGWTMSGITSMQQLLTQVSTNVTAMQKTINDMQTAQGAAASRVADMQATQARQDARISAIEGSTQRLSERMRIVEGQKPLAPLLQ